jgi:hypothetical protein
VSNRPKCPILAQILAQYAHAAINHHGNHQSDATDKDSGDLKSDRVGGVRYAINFDHVSTYDRPRHRVLVGIRDTAASDYGTTLLHGAITSATPFATERFDRARLRAELPALVTKRPKC